MALAIRAWKAHGVGCADAVGAGRTTWQMRASTFHGEYGIGIGCAHWLNTGVPLSVVVGYGNGGGREHTAYVGLGGEF